MISGVKNSKPLIILIYPYKFTDFAYNKLEINQFSKFCEVKVWDISLITSPKFAKAVTVERSARSEVLIITSFEHFKLIIKELCEISGKRDICIINEVFNNSIRELYSNFLLSIFLRNRKRIVLEYCNGGTPINFPESSQNITIKRKNLITKAVHFLKRVSTFREATKTFMSVFYQRIGTYLANPTTHRLVAGDEYDIIARHTFRARKQIKVVYGHSEDYSTYLLEKYRPASFKPPYERFATYIDGPGPLFTGDVAYFSRKVYFTSEEWYPAISKFFDRIEAEMGIKIVIAGHYKSKHPLVSPHFGNRNVYYGVTKDLVSNSEFVITRASTAICYAVIFEKPVISIYSNQLLKDDNSMYDISGMAATIGNTPVNIDDQLDDYKKSLTINKEMYAYYKKACLTSSSSERPNFRIILEDVMNIPHVSH